MWETATTRKIPKTMVKCIVLYTRLDYIVAEIQPRLIQLITL